MQIRTALAISALIHLALIAWPSPQEDVFPGMHLQFPVRSIAVRLPAVHVSESKKTVNPADVVTQAQTVDYQERGSTDVPPENTSWLSKYYPVSELEQPPVISEFFRFDDWEIPPEIRGSVVIQLWINESGRVDIIEIEKTDLPPEWDRLFLAERSALRFEPGKIKGIPVNSVVRYSFSFVTEAHARLFQANQHGALK